VLPSAIKYCDDVPPLLINELAVTEEEKVAAPVVLINKPSPVKSPLVKEPPK